MRETVKLLFKVCSHGSGAGLAGGEKGGGVAVAEALGAVVLAVAGLAVDLLVGAVAGQDRVQRAFALGAAEALLVPHGALGELLLGGVHHAAAAGAALALGSLDGRGVRVVEGTQLRNLVLTASEKYTQVNLISQ